MSKEMDCEHNTHGECCWCNPTIEVMPNGNKLIIHNNNISPEEAVMTRDILLAVASSDSTAELLREVRKARKITILEIAKKTGINRNTISGILNGNLINNARLSTISKISHALNCDLRIELKPFESITYEPPETDYLDMDCKQCGRHRVEKDGICEKCNYDNIHNEFHQPPEATDVDN